MLLINRRVASLALMPSVAFRPDASFPSEPSSLQRASYLAFLTAAPGVNVTPYKDIIQALKNPSTSIVDARSVDEIVTNGYWKTGLQWINAQCTLDGGCPLLSVAATDLIPDKKAPVIVYCASGKRGEVAQKTLQRQGYEHVLNAGAFPSDTDSYLN